MTDDRFEEFVQSAVRELDPVPEVPREEMWARIAEARRFRRRARPVVWKRWTPWAVGAAALLAVGFGVGRLSTAGREPATPAVAAGNQPATREPSEALPGTVDRREETTVPAGARPRTMPPNGGSNGAPYRLAALRHLSRAEGLLTSVAVGDVDQQLATWASDLLTTTRLILDSPAVEDPKVARLLEDLELILAQIASASEDRRDAELHWIQQGMETNNVLPRLRAALPADRVVSGT